MSDLDQYIVQPINYEEHKKLAGWYKPKSTKVTMEPYGRPDLWVEIKKTASMTRAEAKAITVDADEDGAKALAFFILDWNMTDPYTDEPLAVPTTDDPSSIDYLPSEIIEYLGRSINPDQETAVPPEIGNSSGTG